MEFLNFRNILSFIAFICIIISFSNAERTSAKIEGRILDSYGNPIADAQIQLTPGNILEFSDKDGYFILTGPLKGKSSLKITHVSFHEHIIKNISIYSNKNIDLDEIKLTGKIFSLKNTIVTATRSKNKIIDLTNAVNVVDKIEINNRNAKTSAEALREESGIFVQKTNHGGGSAIIRGLSSNQVLLMVDGIRLNNSTYRLGNHQYLTTVDNNMIEQMEVVKGPTSVQYGSDALGGTINMVTQTPEFSQQKLKFHYKVMNRYATADEEKLNRTQFSVHGRKIAFTSGFSYKDFGDLRRGNNSHFPELENSTNGNKQSPSGFNAYDFDSKLIYAVSNSQNLIFNYQMSRQYDVPRYDKYENNDYYKWLYDLQKRDLFYIKYKNQLNKKHVSSFDVSLIYHHQQEGRTKQKVRTSPLQKNTDKVKTTGIIMQFSSFLPKQILSYGIDGYFDKISSSSYITFYQTETPVKQPGGRYPDDAEYNSIGTFIQNEFQASDDFLFTGGMRYNYYYTDFTTPPSSFEVLNQKKYSKNFKAVTGSIGMNYKITPNFAFSANAAHAYRAPNLSDMAKLDESKGNIIEIPNLNLAPEKLINFETGIKANFERFSGSFTVYQSKINDLIASAPATLNGSDSIEVYSENYKLKSKQNTGKAIIRGCELFFNYIISQNFTLHSNFSFTWGKNNTINEPVGGIPPAFGLVGLKYNHQKYHLYFYSRFAAKQDRLSADDMDDPRIPENGTPAWYTLNFRVQYPINRIITLRFSVENILDYNYREHGSGINGPGRNFVFGLTLGK